jgi:hypothetical protein
MPTNRRYFSHLGAMGISGKILLHTALTHYINRIKNIDILHDNTAFRSTVKQENA